MDREVGLKAEEAFVGSGKTVQHSALVRRSASVSETQRGRRRARHHVPEMARRRLASPCSAANAGLRRGSQLGAKGEKRGRSDSKELM